jgi:hypothetical protein
MKIFSLRYQDKITKEAVIDKGLKIIKEDPVIIKAIEKKTIFEDSGVLFFKLQ